MKKLTFSSYWAWSFQANSTDFSIIRASIWWLQPALSTENESLEYTIEARDIISKLQVKYPLDLRTMRFWMLTANFDDPNY